MALKTITGGMWIPTCFAPVATDETVYVIDAAGEKAALIFECPQDGVLDRFDAHVAVVTNTPDNLRFSFQGVSPTGLPDGVILGATGNAFVNYATPVTAGWKSTNFGEPLTVTRGQKIAAVVDIPVFTLGDSVTLRCLTAQTSIIPYGVSATSTRQSQNLLVVGLHYTTGYAIISPTLPAVSEITSVTITASSNPDEYALAFSFPGPFKINLAQFYANVDAGADFEVILYGADGATPLAPAQAYDGDQTGSTAPRNITSFLSSEVMGLANTVYRLAFRPTTSGANLGLYYAGFASLALMETRSGGASFFLSTRVNQGGAWTDHNSGTFRVPFYSLNVSALDDGAGGGGGGGVIGGGGSGFGETWG
jgi:hypothetical protein